METGAVTSARRQQMRTEQASSLKRYYFRTTDVGIASRGARQHDNLALFACRRNGGAHALQTSGVAPA